MGNFQLPEWVRMGNQYTFDGSSQWLPCTVCTPYASEYGLVSRNALKFAWRELYREGKCLERGENSFPWTFDAACCCSPRMKHCVENQKGGKDALLAVPAGASVVWEEQHHQWWKSSLLTQKGRQERVIKVGHIGFVKPWEFNAFMKERVFQGPCPWQHQTDSSARREPESRGFSLGSS